MNTEKIRQLNDMLRKTFIGGQVMLTTGIRAKSSEDQAEILHKVRLFNEFTKANDPYAEHDYGRFSYNGEDIMFKIDYYNKTYDRMSDDPSNPDITNRVMTIMCSDEY
ncbi:MAG: DUF3768 domain-containing protein [Alphaproteobacteria bacterium]|nr:DUF3768 domain-containing protein [Alphaproteobacteria bacterium]